MDPLGALGPALLKIGASNVWADVTNLQYEFKLNLAKVETLQEWTKTVDPATYLKVATQQGEWPDEMKRAYLSYKALAELIKPSKDNYKALSNKFGRTPTPAQCLQLAELAIQSGEVVLNASKARIQFQMTYVITYPSIESVSSHLKQASDDLNGIQSKLNLARMNLKALERHLAKI